MRHIGWYIAIMLWSAPILLLGGGLLATNAGYWRLAESLYTILISLFRPFVAVTRFAPAARLLISAQVNLTYVWMRMHKNDPQAILLLREADGLCKKYDSTDSVERASILLNLAGCLARTDRTEESIGCEQEALALYEKKGDIKMQASALVTFTANALRSGNLNDAEKWGTMSVRLLRRTHEEQPNFESLTMGLNNLGIVYGYKFEWNKASEIFSEALELKRAKLNPRDPSLVAALNNCGWATVKSNRLDEAERYLKEAAQLSEGNDFVDANTRINMAVNTAETERKRGK